MEYLRPHVAPPPQEAAAQPAAAFTSLALPPIISSTSEIVGGDHAGRPLLGAVLAGTTACISYGPGGGTRRQPSRGVRRTTTAAS